MEKRSREILLKVYVSEEEHDLIRQKMAQTGVDNFSLYARKMLIDGYVIRKDYASLKALTKEIGSLSRSINQIAKRANETRSVYEQDIIDLRSGFYQVKRKMTDYLIRECSKEK